MFKLAAKNFAFAFVFAHLLSESPAVDLHDDGRPSLAPTMRHGTVDTGADRASPWWQRWHTDGRRLTDRWHVCAHRCARSGRLDTRRFGTSACFIIQLQLAHFTHITLQTELQGSLLWTAPVLSDRICFYSITCNIKDVQIKYFKFISRMKKIERWGGPLDKIVTI